MVTTKPRSEYASGSPLRSRQPARSVRTPPALSAPRGRSRRWSARRRRRPPRRSYGALPTTGPARRSERLGHHIEPVRLAARAAASSPAWSATRVRKRSIRSARTSYPCRRRRAAAPRVIVQVGSCPRARTAAGREGTGASTTGTPPAPASSTAPAHGAREQLGQGPAQPVHRAFLVAEHQGACRTCVVGGGPGHDHPVRYGSRPCRERWLLEGRSAGGTQQPARAVAAHAP